MKVRDPGHFGMDMKAEKNYLAEGVYVNGEFVPFDDVVIHREPRGLYINDEYWRFGRVSHNGNIEILRLSKL